ncbi:MAG: heat-inducible transcription repressor HrcA [Candidatus Omnitrophica bacterium]|nr:heat-inducible transcription repressor HrcA [Candidatus Omnitrophota bacterium]
MANNIYKDKEGRKTLVLGHIVHEYVSKAAPVSSMTVSRRMGGGLSSATIRNIMAELEEEGYIEQPHTSAGRIPTQLGYRRYVDIVRDNISQQRKEAERLAAEYDRRITTIKEVIRRTSYLISRELHNAGVAIWPSIEDYYLKHFELVKVKAESVLAILVTMTNDVKNHIVKLDREMKKTELEKISNYINSRYVTEPISVIYEDLKRGRAANHAPESSRKETFDVARTALGIIDAIIDENIEEQIYWEGLDHFMEGPESRDADITRNILQIFSDKRDLVNMMRRELPYRGLKVYIGEENDSRMLKSCSVITCGYSMRGRTIGRIGVIGPTRMDYDHALRTVSCLSYLISEKLKKMDD